MHLTDLKSWHWLIIALLVGITGGELRVFSLGKVDPANIPTDLSQQQLRFEEALLGEFKGQPLLVDIEISPRRISDRKGDSRLFHVITARYCSGAVEEHDGQRQVFWRPSVFLMPVPYKPQINLQRLNGAGRPDAAHAWAAVSNPTVVDFLRLVGRSRNVAYTYAWWDLYPRFTVLGASVLLLGILLPALINVLTFGSLRRPREAPGIKLRASPKRDEKAKATEASEHDNADQILDQPMPDVSVSTASAAPATAMGSKPPPPKSLPQEPVQTAAAVASEAKDFAAKKDDYYPTERRRTAQGKT